MEFDVLGPLRVTVGGRAIAIGSARQRAVLARLLRSANHTVSIPGLIDAVWGQHPARSAQNMLHTHLWRLRATLVENGEPRLLTEPAGYRLWVEPGELDLSSFEHLSRRGHDALLRGDAARAAADLRTALGLWRGEPFADAALHDDEQAAEVRRLDEARTVVLEDRIEADLVLGRHEALVDELQQLTLLHPLRERIAGQLMLALYRSGRRADALAAFARIRTLLARELGLDPGGDLRDLHHGILSADPNLSTARPPLQDGDRIVPRQLPTTPTYFAGRSAELSVLNGLLDQVGRGRSAVISVIHGTAGIGKTTLVLHWGHQNLARFADGQVYVNLRGFGPDALPVTPAEAIRGFLDALAVPADRIPRGLEAQAALYRSLLADKRILLVLDNARDIDQIRPLLPGSPTALTLVTSRNPLSELTAAEGASPITLNLLTTDEAHALLTRRLGAERTAAEAEAVGALIELCARLPLALSITAARAAVDPGLTVSGLVAELNDARGRLDALDVGDAATDLRAVFSWSYQHLTAPAARLFRLLALHSGPDISTAAAASLAGLAMADTLEVLGELTGAHLVSDGTPGRYAMHDLLRAYAVERAHTDDSRAERRAALHRVLDHYLHCAHAAALRVSPARTPIPLPPAQPGVTIEGFADDQRARGWLETEHPVLMAAINLADAAEFDTHACVLPWVLSNYFNQRGYWNDYLTIQHYTLAAARRLGDLPEQARAYRFLGSAHTRLDAYEDAHAALRSALDLQSRLDDVEGQAHTRLAVGALFHQQGDHRESLEYTRQSLTLFEAADHQSGQADALNAIGWLHSQLGEHEQALVHCRRALALHRRLGDRFGQAHTADSLGYAYHHLGRHTQALTCYREALGLYRTIGDRHSQATTLARIGDMYRAIGDSREAEKAWQQAVTMLDDMRSPGADEVRAKLRRSAEPVHDQEER